MAYAEKNLLKLLEAGRLSAKESYEAISDILGLEFYTETDSSVYSIGSSTFVLDISDSRCTLLFVDESHQSTLSILQQYLNAYIHNKPLFYLLIKFVVGILDIEHFTTSSQLLYSAGPEYAPESDLVADLTEYKNVCNCIITGNYCYPGRIRGYPESYNVFTHRVDFVHFNPLISIPVGTGRTEKQEHGVPAELGGEICVLSPDASEYFRPDQFTMNALDNVKTAEPLSYEYGNIKIVDRDVFIDGSRSEAASFLFKRGCSVKEVAEYMGMPRKG